MRGKEDELLKESENEIDYPEPDDDSLVFFIIFRSLIGIKFKKNKI